MPAGQDVCQRSHGRAGRTVGGHMSHSLVTVNVGGSREGLLNAFGLEADVLLIQEHRLAPTALHGIQCQAAQRGWHGLWDPAEVSLPGGRSGGTAVLVRKPLLIFRRSRPKGHLGRCPMDPDLLSPCCLSLCPACPAYPS